MWLQTTTKKLMLGRRFTYQQYNNPKRKSTAVVEKQRQNSTRLKGMNACETSIFTNHFEGHVYVYEETE